MNKNMRLLTAVIMAAALPNPVFGAKKKVTTEEQKDPNEMVAASETLGLDSETEIGNSSDILSSDPNPNSDPFEFIPELDPFKF